MALSSEEIERYKRHLVLREVGGQGQQKLKAAKVLVIGAGGLGSPLLMYLAAAGVGTIGIIDDDHVSLDNLQRQIVHDTAHVGVAKVESAREMIARLNPHVRVETHEARIDAGNALEIICRYDIVADGSDNFATRYLVSDACYLAKRTLVFAAVGPFDGYVTTFKPHETGPDGEPFPTYRCIFPEPPPPGHGRQLRRGRRAGSGGRGDRHAAGHRGAEGDRRHRRGAGRPSAALRRARRALQRDQGGLGPGQPALGPSPTIRDLSIHAGAQQGAVCAA